MSYVPEHVTVWAEIPVRDLEAAVTYYAAVTGVALRVDDSGPNPIAMFLPKDPASGVAGHLYPGTPAPEGVGPTVHLAAEGTLEEALERVKAAGGTVLSEPISIPAGRFAYTKDPDGNSVGLFQVA